MIELGYPDIHFDGWFGTVAPAKTPSAVLQRLRDDMAKAANAPDVVEKFTGQGTIPLTSASPAEFQSFIASEIPRLARVVKISGATAE
jgi:tripartite-type tricarboxylate transporter receptor subunit TctC